MLSVPSAAEMEIKEMTAASGTVQVQNIHTIMCLSG